MDSRCKSKEESNLVWLDKHAEGDTTLSLAIRVISIYKNDYNLTIQEIASILKCERQWVEKNIRDNVKHIFLNDKYKAYLNLVAINNLYESIYLKDYYYFSRSDFFKWLRKNIKVTRQTIRLNLVDYVQNTKLLKSTVSKFKREMNDRSITPRKKASIKSDFKKNVVNMLDNDEMQLFTSNVVLTKRTVESIEVNLENIPQFISAKELKIIKGYNNLELVYRNLYLHGALKYTIADSLVRYDVDYDKLSEVESGLIVTIPYKLYIQYIQKKK